MPGFPPIRQGVREITFGGDGGRRLPLPPYSADHTAWLRNPSPLVFQAVGAFGRNEQDFPPPCRGSGALCSRELDLPSPQGRNKYSLVQGRSWPIPPGVSQVEGQEGPVPRKGAQRGWMERSWPPGGWGPVLCGHPVTGGPGPRMECMWRNLGWTESATSVRALKGSQSSLIGLEGEARRSRAWVSEVTRWAWTSNINVRKTVLRRETLPHFWDAVNARNFF